MYRYRKRLYCRDGGVYGYREHLYCRDGGVCTGIGNACIVGMVVCVQV